MLKLRQGYKPDQKPALLGRDGDLLILLTSFLVTFFIPLSGAHEITEKHDLTAVAFAISATMPANQARFQTIAKGYRSGMTDSLQTVARNQAEWGALWQRHTSIELNPPSIATIDFSKEIVIAIFLGEKPTGGHDIEIVRVEQSNNQLLVSFVEKSPRPGGAVTQALTQPFHIVRVAAQSAARVNFRRLP